LFCRAHARSVAPPRPEILENSEVFRSPGGTASPGAIVCVCVCTAVAMSAMSLPSAPALRPNRGGAAGRPPVIVSAFSLGLWSKKSLDPDNAGRRLVP
jgi:hypothetical protein